MELAAYWVRRPSGRHPLQGGQFHTRLLRPDSDSVLLRRRVEDHRHLTALQAGPGLHLADTLDRRTHLVQNRDAEFRPAELTVAEEDRHLNLLALAQEAQRAVRLDLVVVRIDRRPVLDLLQIDRRRLPPRLLVLLVAFELDLAPVQNANNGRIRVRTYFNEIEPCRVSARLGLIQGDDTQLGTVLIDEPYRAFPDPVVDARLLRWGCDLEDSCVDYRAILLTGGRLPADD